MSNRTLRYTTTLFLLSLLGLAGNYLSITLFFGVNFVFGSIAVLAAVKLLGTRGAVVTALIAGSYTYVLWGHPYALIIFTAEAVFVSYLSSKRNISLTIADIVYWLVLGMPLIWLFYKYTMGMSGAQSELILFKQPVNGIFNAIVATYLLYLIPAKYRPRTQDGVVRIRLQEAIFNLLLTFSLLSTLTIIIYQNDTYHDDQELALRSVLSLQSRHIKPEIAQAIASNTLQQSLNTLSQNDLHSDGDREIIVVSKNNDILASTLPEKLANTIITKKYLSQTITDNLYIFTPDEDDLPAMLKWQRAMYYSKSTHTEQPFFNLYILETGTTVANALQKNIKNSLLVLFIVIIISSITAYFICKILTAAITELTHVTQDIPEKLRKNSKINWPISRISEIEKLTNQTKLMADNIRDSLDDASTRSTAIIESSIDAIVTTDEKGIIQGFNRAAEKQFLYPRRDVIGKHVRLLLPESQHAALHTYLVKPEGIFSNVESSAHYTLRGQRENGTTFPMEISVTEVTLHEKTIYTAIITDITERRANEKLKREFISTVSHELRTPLTSIKGSVNLLSSKIGTMPLETSSNLLDITSRNVERLSELIDDILDFDKLESGSFEYVMEKINVAHVITELLEEMLSIARQADIQIQQECQLENQINVDPKRFLQILRNLVSNAIKFSSSGSVITIRCESIADEIKISVTDQGVGISEEFSKKIFSRFSQADSSDTRKIQRGTGLGLAISKHMVEDMGGSIGFNSVEHEGSTFYLTFPSA